MIFTIRSPRAHTHRRRLDCLFCSAKYASKTAHSTQGTRKRNISHFNFTIARRWCEQWWILIWMKLYVIRERDAKKTAAAANFSLSPSAIRAHPLAFFFQCGPCIYQISGRIAPSRLAQKIFFPIFPNLSRPNQAEQWKQIVRAMVFVVVAFLCCYSAQANEWPWLLNAHDSYMRHTSLSAW